jgi:peptidoglycan/LPS O-acetylase OafA/YrhL
MKQSGRVMQLDILRALAIVLVLGRHMPPFEQGFPAFMQPFCKYWIRFGWAGVDLFFVLSGFLISGLLFREHQRHGGIRFGRFFVRRGFKIYPSFWVYVAAVVYIQHSNYNFDKASARQIVPDLLFVANYWPGLLDHSWSLGVEEHFYLFLPLLLVLAHWIGRRRGAKPFGWVPWACLGVSVVALGLRLYVSGTHAYADRTHAFPTHLRMDSLFFGVLLSYLYNFHGDGVMGFVRRYRWFIAAGALVPLVMVGRAQIFTPWVHTWGFTALFVAFGALLMVSLTVALPGRGVASWPFRAVAFAGAHSYAIYLWHMPVKIWGPMYAQRWFGLDVTPLPVQLAVYVGASVVIGVVLSVAVEYPILRLRDWLIPSRSRPLARVTAPDGEEAASPAALAPAATSG